MIKRALRALVKFARSRATLPKSFQIKVQSFLLLKEFLLPLKSFKNSNGAAETTLACAVQQARKHLRLRRFRFKHILISCKILHQTLEALLPFCEKFRNAIKMLTMSRKKHIFRITYYAFHVAVLICAHERHLQKVRK